MDEDLGIRPEPVQPRRSGWAVVVVLAAMLFGGGMLFYNTPDRAPDQTASNRPTIQTNPSGPERAVPGSTSNALTPAR